MMGLLNRIRGHSQHSGTQADTSYEQLELQRKNPFAYTTLSQCVNPDGTITTFDQVTARIQDSLQKLQEFHTEKFGGTHPLYCLQPISLPGEDLCNMIEFHKNELSKVRRTFVRNYKYMQERHHSVSDLQPYDSETTPKGNNNAPK